MARRPEVQIFSISMLDTITCGLGGAIVLMLFLASEIPPQAVVVFDNADENPQRGTPPEGMGEVRINTGILTVFLEFEDAVDPQDFRPAPCDWLPEPSADQRSRLTIAHLGEASEKALFSPPPFRREFGYSLWWRGLPADMPPGFGCFAVPVVRPCRFRYVAGAHYTEWRDCAGAELIFERKKNPSFFELTP